MDALSTARCAAQDACTDPVFVSTGACEVCASAARSTDSAVDQSILDDCLACYSACDYKPLAAQACLDLAPWTSVDGGLKLPPACRNAYECGGPGTTPGGTTGTTTAP